MAWPSKAAEFRQRRDDKHGPLRSAAPASIRSTRMGSSIRAGLLASQRSQLGTTMEDLPSQRMSRPKLRGRDRSRNPRPRVRFTRAGRCSVWALQFSLTDASVHRPTPRLAQHGGGGRGPSGHRAKPRIRKQSFDPGRRCPRPRACHRVLRCSLGWPPVAATHTALQFRLRLQRSNPKKMLGK